MSSQVKAVSPPVAGGAPRRRPRRRRLAVVLVTVAALLVVGVLYGYGAYGYLPAEAGRSYRSPYLRQVGSRFVDTPAARFHYVRAGSGPPVILLSPGRPR
ncbi:MAG TPA: hypothetical protein VG276_15385 [Actinomycetes bacterium]|jgi:pyruvate dehydrogenase E2 component (dihydrolipoamide acetyltransferase)/4,5:9,10-diseco-3-hydroxy-5,9,17-trioxoandrosta-1(10),2-diene-4-oate hydrolase|nr:hypothetical protein [Actinomycetes bacterium]